MERLIALVQSPLALAPTRSIAPLRTFSGFGYKTSQSLEYNMLVYYVFCLARCWQVEYSSFTLVDSS
jgi:hypothetical protein